MLRRYKFPWLRSLLSHRHYELTLMACWKLNSTFICYYSPSDLLILWLLAAQCCFLTLDCLWNKPLPGVPSLSALIPYLFTDVPHCALTMKVPFWMHASEKALPWLQNKGLRWLRSNDAWVVASLLTWCSDPCLPCVLKLLIVVPVPHFTVFFPSLVSRLMPGPVPPLPSMFPVYIHNQVQY